MYSGYHLQNRVHALKALTKTVMLPNARLAIGEGETLHPMSMKMETVKGKQKVVIPELYSKPIEQATIDGQGVAVKPEDFPRLNYIGETIGGF